MKLETGVQPTKNTKDAKGEPVEDPEIFTRWLRGIASATHFDSVSLVCFVGLLALLLNLAASNQAGAKQAAAPPSAVQPGAIMVRVEPREIDDLLANPGMGWQAFHHFADDDKNLQGLPSASAYFRFYWREIEPRDGEIDFARFDELLAHARRAGQKFAFRIMCTGSGQYREKGMKRTVKDRLGWRADCLGDMGGFSKTWNHMDHFYLQQLAKTGAQEA